MDFVNTLAVSYDSGGTLQVMESSDWFVVQSYDADGLPVGPTTVSDPAPRQVVRFASGPLGGFTVVYGIFQDGIFSQTYIVDTTPPTIVSAVYDYDAALIHLEFSEPDRFPGEILGQFQSPEQHSPATI